MELLEYEAKGILKNYGIAIPSSVVVSSEADLENVGLPAVLKSQVPTGGRGKLGGVKPARDRTELEQVALELFKKPIKGYYPSRLLAEQFLDIDREFFVSFMINRDTSTIELAAHKEGGIEVESRTQQSFFRREADCTQCDRIASDLCELLGIGKKKDELKEMLEKLMTAFREQDMLLLEINPLVLTKQGDPIAGDAKIELDNAAQFRHPDWSFEQPAASANFVVLDPTGTVGTMANGAGLAMATVDAVVSSGRVPANFLDVGGGATTEKITESFNKIMALRSVHAIIINIFGGIVRCDLVAEAIIEARTRIPHLPPLFIRLSGTNSKEAAAMLESHGITLYENLETAMEACP